MIAPGEKLSRYHLREPLGSGGMSCVYRAYDPVLDREVAIKILPAELARDPVLRERFHEEARALGGVEQPNLIRIFAVGQEGPVSYYAMELITGMSLKEVLAASGRLTVAEAFAVMGQVLRALEAVHRAGIVHRDLKPGNVMLAASGRVVLMDFGLARRAERQDLTMAGAVLGTPEYMSPEQARGEKADERSDLYSIGVMLYEMLAGRPPFGGKDTIAILRQHVQAPVPPLPARRPGRRRASSGLSRGSLQRSHRSGILMSPNCWRTSGNWLPRASSRTGPFRSCSRGPRWRFRGRRARRRAAAPRCDGNLPRRRAASASGRGSR